MKLGCRRPGALRSREKSRALNVPFSAITAVPIGRYSCVPAAHACSPAIQSAKPMNDIIERMNRRSFASSLAAGAAFSSASPAQVLPAQKGRLKQGVCGGVFRGSNLDFDGQCKLAAELGLVGYDLQGPERFETLKKYGLVPTMLPGSSKLSDGTNDLALHPEIIANTNKLIDQAAAAGAPNIIMLSGNRRGRTDEQGIENTVRVVNAVKKHAEDKGVTLCMELLNSKVNHPDYQCDRTWWGVEVCKRVDSPRFKLLYDIYHMQIMEGDIIRTIEQNFKYFGHFHTAGNPGRHELSIDQEINYKAICKKILELGYTGYISHEYTPVVKPVREALLEAIEQCTVV